MAMKITMKAAFNVRRQKCSSIYCTVNKNHTLQYSIDVYSQAKYFFLNVGCGRGRFDSQNSNKVLFVNLGSTVMSPGRDIISQPRL
jgi:hypothetical protein